jgi:hypothetical protein
MKIIKYTFQHANDFYAIIECEHCLSTQELKSGYHDGYYHNHVLPAIKCKTCGKDRNGHSAEIAA